MKKNSLLVITFFGTALAFGVSGAPAADDITTSTRKTADDPITREEVVDPRVAAQSLVEHVNHARVAMALKNSDLAKKHITQAQNMVTLITGATAEKQRITEIESGRIVYQYETEYKYHYFPIQTGLVEIKQIDDGPAWTKSDLAVTDADIVYLTVDLTDNKAATYLKDAETAILKGNLREADNQLARMVENVVKVDSRVSVPHEKARDNIALSRRFVAGKNYDGARNALNHADDALDEMQNSEGYKSRRKDIIAMRQEVNDIQQIIGRRDPSILEKLDNKMETWWNNLNNWANTKSS